jgi:hypothetical protein
MSQFIFGQIQAQLLAGRIQELRGLADILQLVSELSDNAIAVTNYLGDISPVRSQVTGPVLGCYGLKCVLRRHQDASEDIDIILKVLESLIDS